MEIIIVIVILASFVITNIKIVPQSETYVIERLGSYYTTWENGLHFKIPFIDVISNKVTKKELLRDFNPQPVITKDNVTMQIDSVVYYQITDPKLFTYGIERPVSAIENLTATTLRNLIGELELDQTLTSRDVINSKMRIILDEATDPWGIKVNRVEVKNILPPQDIQEAMEKQMRAERERREKILQAEGEKQSKILQAEGEKESKIKRAQGEAESIKILKQAEADGIKLLNEAKIDNSVLKLKSYDALIKMAEGEATKIFIPTELSGIASFGAALNETLKKDTNK